jgi:hypothetical protein
MGIQLEVIVSKNEISFQVKITISKEDIENLIVSAFEGGSNYWYQIESKTFGNYLETVFTHGLTVSNARSDEGKTKIGYLNKTTIQEALIKMEREFPRHFNDIRTDNADAITGDVFLQLAVLGEVIYG